MKVRRSKTLSPAGFTLLELIGALVVTAAVTILSCTIISDHPQTQAREKMADDIRGLNAAVDVYRIFGGSLTGLTSVEDVLLRLKSPTGRSAGNLLDVRLRAEMQTDSEARRPGARVAWNPGQELFEMQHTGDIGAKGFWLDESLASMEIAFDTSRDASGWIADRSMEGEIAKSATPGIGISARVDHADGGTRNFAGAEVLEAPIFSLPAGEYAILDFDLNVRIQNPNPKGLSRILYSIDEGPWMTYDGSVVVVQPGTRIRAFADSTDPAWRSSEKTGDTYVARVVKLNSPRIVSSAPRFDFSTQQVVQVSMEDPNQKGVSKLEFRVDGGPWQSYVKPFDLGVFNFRQHGADIEARAVPVVEHFKRSEIAKTQVGKPGPAAARSSRGKSFLENAMGISQTSRHRVVRAVVAPLAHSAGN